MTDQRRPQGSPARSGEGPERAGENTDVEATSRWGKPVTIAGAAVVVFAILWGIVAGGWFF